MDNNSVIKYLTVEETRQALQDCRKDGVVRSQYLSELPVKEQERVKAQFEATFTDDRSAYHREYMANMKAKEERQEISDDEEERIIKAYVNNKEFHKFRAQAMKEKAELEKQMKELENATTAKENWGNDKTEAPDVVVNFD